MTNANRLLAWILAASALGLASCGRATPQPNSLACANSCKTPSSSVASCCASNGGPQTCVAAGQYDFDCTGKLICSDGTTSPTCTN